MLLLHLLVHLLVHLLLLRVVVSHHLPRVHVLLRHVRGPCCGRYIRGCGRYIRRCCIRLLRHIRRPEPRCDITPATPPSRHPAAPAAPGAGAWVWPDLCGVRLDGALMLLVAGLMLLVDLRIYRYIDI